MAEAEKKPVLEVRHNIDHRPVEEEYHSHDCYEALFSLSGQVDFLIEGQRYRLQPGDILLINPNEQHKPLLSGSSTYERLIVLMQPDYIRFIENNELSLTRCFEESSQKHYHVLRPGPAMSECIRYTFDRLETASNSAEYGAVILQKAYLMELLTYLNKAYFESHEGERGPQNQRMENIIRYINENLCEDLSIQRLADEFFISKFYLSREFKKHSGFTLHQYVLKKRLVAAKFFLDQGASVSEAYISSGFMDYSNFSKAFKKDFGMSPRAYRKQLGPP